MGRDVGACITLVCLHTGVNSFLESDSDLRESKTGSEPYDGSIMVSSLLADYGNEIEPEPYDGSITGSAIPLDRH